MTTKRLFAIDTTALYIDYNIIGKANKWIKKSEAVDTVEYKEQYARIMMENGDYKKSQELFNELIDNNPYSTQYWNSLASSQFYAIILRKPYKVVNLPLQLTLKMQRRS